MAAKTESPTLLFIRSLAFGVFLSMLAMYAVHVLGDWTVENYRPDPDTTSTVLLHNRCAVFGTTHTLRPNTDISGMSSGINGTKLAGSFFLFSEGHIPAMALIAVVAGSLLFALRRRTTKISS